LRKNAFLIDVNPSIYKQCSLIQQELSQVFSEENLNTKARENNFIKRDRKITGYSFVKTLVFNEETHGQLSLLDLKCDLYEHSHYHISQEAIHKRFTPEAVSFLKDVFHQLLSEQLTFTNSPVLKKSFFSSLCIRDSTKFKLPVSYVASYPSYGSFNKTTSLMNFQYEFDLFSGKWNSLELTKATRNDQTDSKETINDIKQGSLNIRDLGYITPTYLKAFDKNRAYYINRLPKIGVYQLTEDGYKPIDWKSLDKNIKEKGLGHLEIEVILGKEDKLKTRMVIIPVPESTARARIHKAEQGGKRSNGYQLSKEYKIKAHYNIFITNVPKEVLTVKEVFEAYSLRWQIELVFKTWKSNLNINKVKSMKKERMECQLIAKLIWILLNSKIFQIANNALKRNAPDMGCSLVKFYKQAKKYSQILRYIISDRYSFINWFKTDIIPIVPDLVVEKRINKDTHCQILNRLLAI
jgi:IS4 transposase